MKKKRSVLLTTLLMIVLLAGCKPSEEKLSEAESARSSLLAARDTAEETYLDIADTSMRSELDALGVQVAEIEAIDFTNMSDKKINEVLPKIAELSESYGTVQAKLSGTYQEETAVKKEQAKNVQIDAYIINKMGADLSSIVLHDLSADTYSDDLIAGEDALTAGYTLMGVKLEIYTDSSQWEFVVTDTAGNTYNVPCEDLRGFTEKGVSLSFEYDKETDSGVVTFGGYF
ncbi:hypothetical protein [Butyrivibrio sp. VCB2006]|uniref:hypothetical protein n=1 Tax=Butyrivibrio sp. VCB2006 TaxID=1280679 RepID=UPI000401F02A|nr:hypothetical protein [Butyrivibrio sp. VCB2006]